MWIWTRTNLLWQYQRMKIRRLEQFNKPCLMRETVLSKRDMEQESSTTEAIHQEYMPSYGHNALNPYNRGSRH